MLNPNLLNYPLPVISISNDGFVKGKNRSMDMIFNVVHVGALVKNYTNIDYKNEKIARGTFCNVECLYCTIFDGDDTMLFLSLDTFGEASHPYNIVKIYKEKIKNICTQPPTDNKIIDCKYSKSVNSNLIRAKYFTAYHQIFTLKSQKQETNETAVLSKICTAINSITTNFLDDISIKFDIDYYSGNMIADVSERTLVSIMLNTLSFCVINSVEDVRVGLTENKNIAELSFSFKSRATFDKWLDPTDDALLNSSLSLIIAFELAKQQGFEYNVVKSAAKNLSEYTLTYKIPVKIRPGLTFSSGDTAMPIVRGLFALIFFDQTV